MTVSDNCKVIFEKLDELGGAIIDTHESKLRLNLLIAQNASSPVLVYHLPKLLNILSLVLKNAGNWKNEHASEISSVSKIHAEHRATKCLFTLKDILREYSLLRETIIELIWERVSLEADSAKLIHLFLDHCVETTVLEFERIQNANIVREKRLRERFYAALTHDLRVPLTAAMMSSDMIKLKTETTSFQRKNLQKIDHNLARMENMIQDFLDVASLQSGQLATIKFSQFNLNQLIEETIENLITIHGPRFVFNHKESFNVVLGKRSIQRIIENLATNGIKYGSTSGMITISLSLFNEYFELEVHNEGNPIEIDDPNELFNDFVRSDSARESDKIGWGIGLPLVKGLVDAHHGKIIVESHEDTGTSFIIRMPLTCPPT